MGQVQLHKEKTCLRAENCNCIYLKGLQNNLQLTASIFGGMVQVQRKHAKNFSIKNFGAPKPRNALRLAYFLHFEGKRPQIKSI